MSDTREDPKQIITEAMQEVRAAMGQLRESVVMLVMRRNRLNDEAKRVERILADLHDKARQAEEQHREQLASELRNELTSREAELGRLRQQLIEAEVEAESAKSRLPEEEARLAQQLSDLQGKLVRLTSARIADSAFGEDSLNRAEDKLRTLQNESLARQQLAGANINTFRVPSYDERAEQQLQALEERLGISAPPPTVPEPVTPSQADFLEFEASSEETSPTAETEAVPEPEAVETSLVEEVETSPQSDTADPVMEEAFPTESPAEEAEMPSVIAEPITEALEAEELEPVSETPEASLEELEPIAEEVPVPEASATSDTFASVVTSEPEFAPEPETELESEPQLQEEAEPLDTEDEAILDSAWASLPETEPELESEPLLASETEVAEETEEAAEPEAVEEVAEVIKPEIVAVAEEVLAPETVVLEEVVVETVEPEPVPHFEILIQTKGESAPMDPDRRIRVAGIGTGNIFKGAHLPAYPEIAGAQMVAFCDPDPKALKLAQERFANLTAAKIEKLKDNKDYEGVDRLNRDLDELKCYEDIQQIIDEVKPELVDICTQPVLHAPLSIRALEAGLNVMCEKPIARSWLETMRLKEAVAKSGKIYQHNENWLFDKDYYTVKKLIDAGAIGELLLMFIATAHGGPEGAPKFWNSDFGGGGALLDNGIHAIGASWYLSGLEKKPTVVKAAAPFGMTTRMPNRIVGGRFQRVTVDDDAHILIRFEDPNTAAWTTAHVEGSWSHRDSPDTCFIGTTGKIVFENLDNRTYAVVYDAYENEARRIETSGPTWQPWISSFYGEILNMVECVRAGVPSIMGADFGAECSAVVGAAYLSQKSGKRAITVEEYKRFALGIAAQYPDDPKAADNALIDSQLAAVRG